MSAQNYLLIKRLDVTVPDSFIHVSMRANFSRMVQLCLPIPQRLSTGDFAQPAPPDTRGLKLISYNLIVDALEKHDLGDDTLLNALLDNSRRVGYWFFNSFILPDGLSISANPAFSIVKCMTTGVDKDGHDDVLGLTSQDGIFESKTNGEDIIPTGDAFKEGKFVDLSTISVVMPNLPCPFPVPPDWPLDPVNYQAVFIVDKTWALTPARHFKVESRSVITPELAGTDPLHTQAEDDNHGEKTGQVILAMARGFPDQQVTLVSANRVNELGNNTTQFKTNLPEALLAVQIQLKAGDLVVINIGTAGDGGQESFARDTLVAQVLRDITDKLGGIVVISAGNTVQLLRPTLVPTGVIVGGVLADRTPQSRFGPSVTCYGVVPYNLPGLLPEQIPVSFDRSSAATAYTAGMVLMMLNYAQSKGLTLTGGQVVDLLKNNGQKTQDGQSVLGALGSLPDWDALRPAIDLLAALGH